MISRFLPRLPSTKNGFLQRVSVSFCFLPRLSAGSTIIRIVSAGSYLPSTIASAGSKRSRTVSAEAKYDGQSLQEAKISGLVYTLCTWSPNQSQNVLLNGNTNYQYNTNVVYNKTGKLIARYHKENLFFEYQFDRPQTTEYIYFDSPFGRFGVFTCFDIMFHDPAVALVSRYNVTNVVFPTD